MIFRQHLGDIHIFVVRIPSSRIRDKRKIESVEIIHDSYTQKDQTDPFPWFLFKFIEFQCFKHGNDYGGISSKFFSHISNHEAESQSKNPRYHRPKDSRHAEYIDKQKNDSYAYAEIDHHFLPSDFWESDPLIGNPCTQRESSDHEIHSEKI